MITPRHLPVALLLQAALCLVAFAASTSYSTLQTSSSTGTMSETASSSSSPSSSSGTQGPSSGTQRTSSTVGRNLAISMGVVGTSIAVLFIFLLWRFCIRRNKGGNGGNQITPQYHTVPTIPENGTTHWHVVNDNNDNSISSAMMTSQAEADVATKSHLGLRIQNNNLFPDEPLPILNLRYHPDSSSYSGLVPSTLYTNESASSLPRTTSTQQQQIHTSRDPQGSISSTLPMIIQTDNSSSSSMMYFRNPNLPVDESTPVSSSNDNTDNGNERSPRIPATRNTGVTASESEVELPSTSIPGRREEVVTSVWDSGYPQPLKFIPIA